AVERCVVKRGSGEVETSGDRVDFRSPLQQQLGRLDVAVHAGINEGVVDNVLTIVLEGGILRRQFSLAFRVVVRGSDDAEIAPGPVDPAGFWQKATVECEEGCDQVRPTQSGGGAEVVNLRAALQKKLSRLHLVPVEGFFERRPSSRAVNRGAMIEK